MGILNFPTELLLLVAENLSLGDLSKFRSASQQICLALTPRFERLCLQDIGELTALQWAAVRGHAELINLAILNGAEIDKPLRGRLDEAALSMYDIHNWNLICEMAYYGADTEAKDSILRTPLYLAACSGHLEAIRALLKLGASMERLAEMNTPAHISAHRGDVDCMRAFIGAKFVINTRGRGGRTILHEAMNGGVEMAMYLLQLEGGGELVNARDSWRQTPLHYAMKSYDLSDKSRVMAEVLLKHGADIHAKDQWEDTPAHIAARMGDVNSMRVFTAAGIDFHARGESGDTILHRAIRNDREGVLEHLLGQEGGRSIIHVRNDDRDTPLDIALSWSQRAVRKLLVGCGANT